jgi:hypothetical protein
MTGAMSKEGGSSNVVVYFSSPPLNELGSINEGKESLPGPRRIVATVGLLAISLFSLVNGSDG